MYLRALPILMVCLGFAAAPAAEAATLSGRISAPAGLEPPAPLSIAVDSWACGADGKISDPRIAIGSERGLANVVITVKADDAPPRPAEGEVVLDQQGCVFMPHVVVVAPGQPLRVKNSDRILHTFRTVAERNRKQNKAQVGGKEDVFVFDAAETIRVECDVHHWMSAVIVVAPHALVAVSDAEGRFEIDGAPDGPLTVELWHEKLGTMTRSLPAERSQPELQWLWGTP